MAKQVWNAVLAALVNPDVGVFAKPTIKLKTGSAIASPSERRPATPELFATIQQSLPAPRFVRAGTDAPPRGMERRLSPYVVERWEAVMTKCPSDDPVQIALWACSGAHRLAGWVVTQVIESKFCTCNHQAGVNAQGIHVTCGKQVQAEVDAQEVWRSIGVQTNDDSTYNGFYPTLPGNDIVHAEYGAKGMAEHQGGRALRDEHGNVIRGGREIQGGRAEWKRAAKGMTLWDAGTRKHAARIEAEKNAKKKKDLRTFVDREVRKMSPNLGEL